MLIVTNPTDEPITSGSPFMDRFGWPTTEGDRLRVAIYSPFLASHSTSGQSGFDLCRVNLEVRTLKPFSSLVFPVFSRLEIS